jgi:hypothetical protein
MARTALPMRVFIRNGLYRRDVLGDITPVILSNDPVGATGVSPI